MYRMHAYIKKVGAVFLLCIFLFIYAEKLVHRHDQSSRSDRHYVCDLKSGNSSCSICDFQSTKEARVAETIITEAVSFPVITINTETGGAYQFLSLHISPGRAPPAC
jgi:hypothetical protein